MTFWPSPSYSDFHIDKTFYQWHDLDAEHNLHRITSGFNEAFATDVACQQGTLTPPDTLFRPPPPFFWGGGTYIWFDCWDQFSRVYTNKVTFKLNLTFTEFLEDSMEWVSEIGCLTSHATIFQLYMWRHIDVQADWRSCTYGRAPNAIDNS